MNGLLQWQDYRGQHPLNPMVDEPGTYILQVTNDLTGCTNTDQGDVFESLNAPFSVASTPGVLNCNAVS
ncbi:MAG: hypothetical protein IPM82_30305 [Saprospiraceae bacterium]|nr:hypothetical protein [Saprospiraceae bacterium]